MTRAESERDLPGGGRPSLANRWAKSDALLPEGDGGFGSGWEPDPDLKWKLHDYFVGREQGEWAWTEHCEGLAEGVLHLLHDLGIDLPGVHASDGAQA